MDYLWSFFFKVNINDRRQRIFVLTICSKILSHPSEETTFSLYLENDYFYGQNCLNQFEIDKLLQKAFQSNNVYVYRSPLSICVDFKEDTIKNVLRIYKQWFQPSINSLIRLDEKKRREWNQNHNINNPEDNMKNDLIKNINKIVPGFNYLIDHPYGAGDLIFGSDYGVYVAIETKQLMNFGTGRSVQVAESYVKNEVKNQAKVYKQIVQEKFMVKVIGVSYTNETKENTIQFADDQDAEIANLINIYYNEIWNMGDDCKIY
ncbi:hypothetical protein C1645_830239 [Glomus cerebriforme]|uniref:Uncharacterized protein n=1 Tax=Glomus cerebriforme TaxID=658196 RepID=A0A397SMF4_9GLOM|nr:hypothetical protein C1645_830239 [Glomus cerebriforme]